MQDKQIVTVRYNEDRNSSFKNSKYPINIYCTGPDVLKDEIKIPNVGLEDYGFIYHIVENYSKLPEYLIFTQFNPSDHVESFDLAIDSTFTGDFGSFCYARSLFNQYALGYCKLLPLKQVLNELDIYFDNENNCSKNIFMSIPGQVFYLHRNKILEKPKSFYEKMLAMMNDDYLLNLVINYKYPHWFYNDLILMYPELKGMSRNDKINFLAKHGNEGRPGNTVGTTFEALWWTIFLSKENLEKLNKEQEKIYNTFSNNNINKNFFLLMENDWFKWDCPYYLKWREKLIEKTIWEGQQRGFDGKQLLEFYERVGYKHISL